MKTLQPKDIKNILETAWVKLSESGIILRMTFNVLRGFHTPSKKFLVLDSSNIPMGNLILLILNL